MATLIDLIGAVDNLGEEPPVLNRRAAILGITISFQILTLICVIFRLYTRFFIMRSPWWDDLFVALSLVSVMIGSIAMCVMTTTGMGQHLLLLSAHEFSGYLRAFWIANATYPGSTAFIKLALLFQYLRIYDKGSKFYIATIATIVFTSLWGLSYSIIGWVPTVPVAGFWNLEMPATRYGYGSLGVQAFVGTYESHAAINMLLDAVVLAIAVPMFFKQGMRKNSYWGLLGFVNMLSIWRLQSIVETRAATYPTFDPTFYGTTPIVLSAIEVDLAAVCASLPVFWPVIEKSIGSVIIVTHEVKITREQRPGGDGSTQAGNDNVELRRQHSEEVLLEDGDALPIQTNRFSFGSGDYYRNSFTSKQQKGTVAPLGRVTSTRVQCKATDESVS
ncbi:hypothetical protein INS49_002007 [Diaporthe citri]|uniref:uncharacterized protein n=1 Tax=Diaporthe citri TaxID=83186 RepID=UPI001C820827|nr:uncharacterized protein INS49_002007 [Diaporthe citri]KAG6367812.1 hypothetical protein INS49_002007 [Diaporthe citri]